MTFKDREEAGRLLAERLAVYARRSDTLVVALPRGGVAVGYEIARRLRLPLEVFVARKLGAPDNPEYAIGAVSETGWVYLNPEAVGAYSLDPADLDRLVEREKQEIARRARLYRSGRAMAPIAGRTVLLVDDGLATGATYFASVAALRNLSPTRLVAAVPVGPRDTLLSLERQVDELHVLLRPEHFFAVGGFYDNFAQLEDADVSRYLADAHLAGLEPH